MSEENTKQSKNTLVVSLIVLLVAVVGFQSWYMVSMKQQLDGVQSNNSQSSDVMNIVTAQNKPAASTAIPVVPKPQPKQNVQAQNSQTAPQIDMSAPNHIASLFNDDFFNQPNSGQAFNPYDEIQRMQREMDRAFNHTFNRFNQSPNAQQFFKQSVTTPQMDVKEDDKQYTVIVNLPGAAEKNVMVNLEGQQLTVKGEQDFSSQNKDAMGNVVFQERRSGSFERSITLPEPVKQSGMESHVSNGVLTITIPKA